MASQRRLHPAVQASHLRYVQPNVGAQQPDHGNGVVMAAKCAVYTRTAFRHWPRNGPGAPGMIRARAAPPAAPAPTVNPHPSLHCLPAIPRDSSQLPCHCTASLATLPCARSQQMLHSPFGDSGLMAAGTAQKTACLHVHIHEVQLSVSASTVQGSGTKGWQTVTSLLAPGQAALAGQNTYCVYVAALLMARVQTILDSPSHQHAGHDTHQLGSRSAGSACSSVTAGLACLCMLPRLELLWALWDCWPSQLPLGEVSRHVWQHGQLFDAC